MNFIKSIFLLTTFIFLSFSNTSLALTKDEIEFEDSITDNLGNTIYLNGLGTRKVTIFRIKVYTAGLYLLNKSHDPQTILDDKGEKQIVLIFHRDVSKEDIQEALEYSFKDNNPDWKNYEEDLNHIIQNSGEMKKGEKITFTFDERGVLIETPTNLPFQSDDKAFGRALLNMWLGDYPPNKSLKEGLLGIED